MIPPPRKDAPPSPVRPGLDTHASAERTSVSLADQDPVRSTSQPAVAEVSRRGNQAAALSIPPRSDLPADSADTLQLVRPKAVMMGLPPRSPRPEDAISPLRDPSAASAGTRQAPAVAAKTPATKTPVIPARRDSAMLAATAASLITSAAASAAATSMSSPTAASVRASVRGSLASSKDGVDDDEDLDVACTEGAALKRGASRRTAGGQRVLSKSEVFLRSKLPLQSTSSTGVTSVDRPDRRPGRIPDSAKKGTMMSLRRTVQNEKVDSLISLELNLLKDLGSEGWKMYSANPEIERWLEVYSTLQSAAAEDRGSLEQQLKEADKDVCSVWRNAFVGIFGRYRSGKSFICSALSGISQLDANQKSNSPDVPLIRTMRIFNIDDDEVGHRALMEAPGSGMPAELYGILSDAERESVFVDTHVCEMVAQESLLNMCQVGIFLVGDLTSSEQMMVTRLRQRIYQREIMLKKLVVLHNLRDVRTQEELDIVWERQVFEKFTDYVNDSFSVPLADNVTRTVRFARTAYDVLHVIVVDDNSPFGASWNLGVFALLKSWIASHCGRLARGLNPAAQLLKYAEEQVQRFAPNVRSLLLHSSEDKANHARIFRVRAKYLNGNTAQLLRWHFDELSSAVIFSSRTCSSLVPVVLLGEPGLKILRGPGNVPGYWVRVEALGAERGDVQFQILGHTLMVRCRLPFLVPPDAQLLRNMYKGPNDMLLSVGGDAYGELLLPDDACTHGRDIVAFPQADQGANFRGLIYLFFPLQASVANVF